eukprot:1157462-Pelagomonas_calceolata.AAC.2
MAGPARPLSGLQRHVLSLFRRCIRAARVKDSQQQGSSDEVALGSWQAYVRAQFEQHRGLKPIRDHMVGERWVVVVCKVVEDDMVREGWVARCEVMEGCACEYGSMHGGRTMRYWRNG